MLTPFETFGFIVGGLLALILLAVIGQRLNGIVARIGELSRIEAKVDLLLKQANIKFDPYQSVPAAVSAAIREGKKITAIKIYRQTTGCGLKEAKDYVEGVQRRGGIG
jgi:hypothetical protein